MATNAVVSASFTVLALLTGCAGSQGSQGSQGGQPATEPETASTAGFEQEPELLTASDRVLLLSTDEEERASGELAIGSAGSLMARAVTGEGEGIDLSASGRTVAHLDANLAHRNDVTAWRESDGYVYVEWHDYGGSQEIGSRLVYRISPPPALEVIGIASVDAQSYDVATLMFQPVRHEERVEEMGSR